MMVKKIRKATKVDLEKILGIYAAARSFMASCGNPTQWGTEYPPKDLVEKDIKARRLFACEGEDGIVHGVFAFIIGADPSYGYIEQGSWPDESPYGTIHRIASDGILSGLVASCVAFCEKQIPTLRADTHRNNLPMQHLLTKNGFIRCGIIYTDDGTSRIAYQRSV